jgi:hypothetical protein
VGVKDFRGDAFFPGLVFLVSASFFFFETGADSTWFVEFVCAADRPG